MPLYGKSLHRRRICDIAFDCRHTLVDFQLVTVHGGFFAQFSLGASLGKELRFDENESLRSDHTISMLERSALRRRCRRSISSEGSLEEFSLYLEVAR